MKIGDYVRIIIEIPPILHKGETGKVTEQFIEAKDNMPAAWCVDFQNGLRSHFVYEDEMEVLDLRVESSS